MGTNYYAESSVHGVPVRLHIGKSSVGWKFLFAQYDNLRSWQEWRAYLERPEVSIVDEYRDPCSFTDFDKIVRNKQTGRSDVSRDLRLDDKGYYFTTSDPEGWS